MGLLGTVTGNGEHRIPPFDMVAIDLIGLWVEEDKGDASGGSKRGSLMNWLNEPPSWSENGGELRVTTGDRTDFWRRTHYGFVRDDGHARLSSVEGDFSAKVTFRGDYAELYDQGGLMLRLDAEHWIKAGIEFVAGRRMLSVVVTREMSDWSTMPCPTEADWITLRLTRIGSAVHVHWSDEPDTGTFRMLSTLR